MNRLGGASSPYLQQHAENPVDWYPWGDEALQRARDENRPILLSIGYSACHWCHVMAHESFDDPETARVMNARFVNIKVDREERPDLDRIYQNAHMLLARRGGGWPLTVILTPDQVPFFAGTYFPRQPRHGLPAFVDVLNGVAGYLRDHPEKVAAQNASLQEALTRMYAPTGAAVPGTEALDAARHELARNFDDRHGGFGGAPKFPHPGTLEWMAAHSLRHGDRRTGEMLVRTLEAMALGGIFDQIGGGFCRYSVDERWIIPHFEKMLYDNGPLLGLYGRQWAVGGQDWARRAAEQTVAWLVREMTGPGGAFYSSRDADSDGHEGRYYVWDRLEVEALLEPEEWRVASAVWGLDSSPNFEGAWHLHRARPLADVARDRSLTTEAAESLLDRARTRLLDARGRRNPPGRDEKILAAWNALAVSGLVRAGDSLQRQDWLDRAEAALATIREHLWKDGRLYASYRPGSDAPMPRAYLDDHALLLAASLDLLGARWRNDLLAWAIALAETMLRDFEDREQGGFHFTATDHEPLIQRPKVHADDAMVSGNAVAARSLLRLGYLLVEPRYIEAAERTLANAGALAVGSPLAHMGILAALDVHLDPPPLVILRGPADLTGHWRSALLARDPDAWVYSLPSDPLGLPQALAGKCGHPTASDRVVAFVCRGTACEPPEYDLDPLLKSCAS